MTNVSIISVAIGGALGSVARFLLSAALSSQGVTSVGLSLGTLAANLIGCLVAGALAGVVERLGDINPEVRALLFSGFLGGFTTFSAFSLEALMLCRRGELLWGGTYVVVSLLGGVGGALLGYRGASGSW